MAASGGYRGFYQGSITDIKRKLERRWLARGNSPRSSNFDKTADYSATSVRFLPQYRAISGYMCMHVGVRNFRGNPFESFSPRIFRGIMKIIGVPLSSLLFLRSLETNFTDRFIDIFIDSSILFFFFLFFNFRDWNPRIIMVVGSIRLNEIRRNDFEERGKGRKKRSKS